MFKLKTLAAALTSFLILPQALASARVIQDNRIAELGMTPSLGRGYSLTNNTIQSLCYKNISKSIPTYNLEYEFFEVDETFMNKTSAQTKLETAYLYDFLKKNVAFSERAPDESGTVKTVKIKNLLAHIKVSSYYYSLDEAQSQLSDSARSILESGDLISFFESCGFYYIRSMGRYATFMALFKFRLDESENDDVFVNNLQRRVFSFYRTTGNDRPFDDEVERRVVRINIQAVGLGKGNLVNLIPTDIRDFKRTIEDAVKVMQDPSSGAITSMEIAPWAENTEFQISIKDLGGDVQDRFREKKNIEENSAVIAEIDRIDRYQMDQYYKAMNCHRILKEEYKVGTGPFEYDPKTTFFYDLANKTNPAQNKSLEELLTLINEASLEELYGENSRFLYGTSDGKSDGALFCMNTLYRDGMARASYRNIPACREVMKTSVRYLPIIEHYCLPEQVDTTVRPVPPIVRPFPRPTIPGPLPTRPPVGPIVTPPPSPSPTPAPAPTFTPTPPVGPGPRPTFPPGPIVTPPPSPVPSPAPTRPPVGPVPRPTFTPAPPIGPGPRPTLTE